MKYKNKEKQKAFEHFDKKLGGLYDYEILEKQDFERLWKKSIKLERGIALQERLSGNSLSKISISANAKLLVNEYLDYGSSILRTFEDYQNENIPFKEKIEKVEVKTYEGRTHKFFNEHGDDEFDGVLLNEWFDRYANGEITKTRMNEIIHDFKEKNPDKFKQVYGDVDKSLYGSK